jgi:hypothetical protein
MADEGTEGTETATVEGTETETQEAGQPAELGDAGKKALDTLRAEKKAAEKEAKEAKAQLDELRRAAMSDQERAIDEAKATTRAEVLGQVGAKIAAAEFKAAASGRLDEDQLSTLLAGLDLKAFLTADGDVDADKVGSFIDGIAPTAHEGRPADLGQGARSTMALNGDPLERDLKAKLGIR